MFKKPVKLTLTVMPTQTTPSSGEISDTSIVFDGKTFTVTFTQTAGETPAMLCTKEHSLKCTEEGCPRFRGGFGVLRKVCSFQG